MKLNARQYFYKLNNSSTDTVTKNKHYVVLCNICSLRACVTRSGDLHIIKIFINRLHTLHTQIELCTVSHENHTRDENNFDIFFFFLRPV